MYGPEGCDKDYFQPCRSDLSGFSPSCRVHLTLSISPVDLGDDEQTDDQRPHEAPPRAEREVKIARLASWP